MSYSDEYFSLKNKKKKKDEEEAITKSNNTSTGNSYADEYFSLKQGITEEETDSALSWRKDEQNAAELGGNKDSWFKSGGFSDGVDGFWDFLGDLGETTLGTAGDLVLSVGKGIGKLAEGIVDLGTYGVAGVADLFGADEAAKDIKKFAQKGLVDDATQGISDYVDQYSVLGNKADMISEGLGQVGGIILTGGAASAGGLGALGTTVLTTGVTGLSGMGSGMSEAYLSGATDEEAVTYGLIAGTAEAATELLFGGLGKASKAIGIGKSAVPIDDLLAKKVTSGFTNQIAKNMVEYGIKAGAEGTEEVLSGIVQAVGKNATYMSEKELGEILEDENLLEQFIVGTVTSGIAQSGYIPGMKNGSLREANKAGKDFITGYTESDQTVIDKEVERRIAEKEQNGTTLTKKQKGEIEEQVKNDVEKGYISIDTIEETLGGDTYKAYKESLEQDEAKNKELEDLKAEYDTLYKMKNMEKSDAQIDRQKELKGIIDGFNLESNTENLKAQLSTEVEKLATKGVLAESYNERARRGEAFTTDLSQYKGKQKEAIERAINSGVLNNTNRSHELVNVLSKIEADKGIVFDYADNAKLKESGFAVEGKTVNGFVKDGAVTLNVQSPKAWQSTVGHEITHILEGTDAYGALQKSLFAYAKSKGELDSRRANLTELYNGIEADIDAELTADLVGEYLFNDKNFIKDLTTDRNLFQKIYDEIKYLCKIATGKELTEIEKVRKEFDKAWKELGEKGVKTKEGIDYSVSEDSKTDSVYSKVVESGNTEIAQKILDETAKKAGYNIKAYHGTGYDFTVFDKSKQGDNYQDWGRLGKGFYFAPTSREAETWAELSKGGKNKVMPVYLRSENMLDSFEALPDNLKDTIPENWDSLTRRLAEKYAYNYIEYMQEFGYDVQKILTEKGYDGINGHTEFVVFDPEQVKSADLATYDDKGDFIPLSQRFNKANDDIRYSISEDSNGNKLSKEQSEYFKDSKVVDENGNLKVMYHGTPNANFTVFKSGTYFTENKEYADVYQSQGASSLSYKKTADNPDTYAVYLDIKKPFDTRNKTERDIFYNEYYQQWGTGTDLMESGLPDWLDGQDLQEFLEENGYDYDGLILDEGATGGYGEEVVSRGLSYVVFSPEQVKNIDNKTPTTDPDIRFSLSETTDNEYMLAVQNGDMETAQRLVNAAAEKAGYTNDTSWKMQHTAPNSQSDVSLYNLKESGLVPDDYWEHPEWYTYSPEERDSFYKVKSAIERQEKRTAIGNKTDASLLVYRAVDKNVNAKEDYFRNGDWVTPSYNYAVNEGKMNPNGYRIINQFVSIKNLYWDGNSIAELGYDDGNDYAYRDTKNNRKLLDAVTYDNEGNVIPLSKRFNYRNADERYSLSQQGEQFAPVGNYSTPMNELALAPTQEDVAQMESTTDNAPTEAAPNIDEAPSIDLAPLPDDAMYDDAPMPSDADVPPVMEDNYYAEPDTTPISENSLKFMGEVVRKKLNLTASDTKAMQEIIQEYATSENPNKAELLDKIQKRFGEVVTTEKDNNLSEVKKYLRETPLYIDDAVKNNITDWADFRKRLNGKIKFAKNPNEGFYLDRYYSHLVERFPDTFNLGMDNQFGDLDNHLNQLQKIEAVVNEKIYKERIDTRHTEDLQNAVDTIANAVFDYKQSLTRKAAEDTAREALDSIAPLKAVQLTDGSRSNALLNQSLDNHPVQTVEQKVAEKIRATEAAIADKKQLRREVFKDYENKIENLSNTFNNLKDQRTKKALKILDQITNTIKKRDSIDAELSKKISDLETRLEKMQTDEYNRAMHKQDAMQGYADWAAETLGDTTHWKDKKTGFQYSTNTEHRNLRDTVRDANGNKDIAKADAIYDATMGEYNRNQAAKNRKVAEVKKAFADMNITKAESTYIQMLGEFRHNPDTTLTEEDVKKYYEKHKRKIDTAKVDNAIELARQTYDNALNELNAKLREQGMKEIPYRKGYFPHFTDPKQNFIQKLFNWKTQDTEIPTSIAGLTEEFKPNKSWQSFDKQRHSDETDYNFLKGLDSYLEGAYDWIYHLEDIQKRRAIENHIRYTHSEEGIKAKIKEVYADENLDADEAQAKIEQILGEAENPLNNFVQDYMTHTNILTNKKNSYDRGMEQALNRKIYSTMTNVQNRVSANMVLANVRSALTNFIPITQSWAQVSPLRSLQATKDVIKNAIKDDGLVNKSTFLTNRLKEADNLYKDKWDKVLDKAGIMFEVVDNFSSQVIWRSKYNQNIAKGMTEAQAIANADQFAENVMAGRSKGNEPTLFNAKNPLVKAFTMFQLEVNNQYGYFFKDVPTDLKAETNHWKLNMAKGYTTAFLGAYAYNALLEQIAGSGAALDPIGIIEDVLRDLGLFDDDEEKEPTEVVTNLIENVGGELPFVGGTLFGGGRIPISSAMPYGDDGLVNGIGDFVSDVSEGNWGNVGKEMMNPLLNVVMPVGGGQLKKTAQGLRMFNEEYPIAGSYTDSGDLRFPVEDTTANRIQAAIFGQWANENAKNYIENGRKPLSEKQTKEFIDVEMPIADYWKYRDGLKGLKKNEEKADYINSLDIEDWQKNLLMNNILDRKEDVDMSNYDDFADWEEFDYAQKNPEKYAVAKSVGGYSSYKSYSDDLNDIKADKDINGKSISGSRKQKVLDYVNNLDADYETKLILFKSEYPSDDTYNAEIINYINNRGDLTYEERINIFEELGFKVINGQIYY